MRLNSRNSFEVSYQPEKVTLPAFAIISMRARQSCCTSPFTLVILADFSRREICFSGFFSSLSSRAVQRSRITGI